MKHPLFYTSLSLLIILFLVISGYVFGWTTPNANPPSSNLPSPINTGSSNQPKSGFLAVGTTTTPEYPLEVGNQLRVWGQLISKVASGTAPFIIDSPTKVANLNADTLDGYDSADLLGGSGLPDIIGNIYIATTFPGLKRVFVTSTKYTGDLGGVAGADTKCQTAANNQGLGGTWKAFILDNTRNNYKQVFTSDLGLYVHPKITTIGTKSFYEIFLWHIDLIISNTYNGAHTLPPFGSPKLYYETLTKIQPDTYYWTGASGSGLTSPYHCTNFTSASKGYGIVGESDMSGTANDIFSISFKDCNTTQSLFCVEQ